MTCEYYGARNGFGPNNGLPINDNPINLDLVETFKKDGETSLKFFFKLNPTVEWKFINRELRDLEFERALSLVKEKSEILNLD